MTICHCLFINREDEEVGAGREAGQDSSSTTTSTVTSTLSTSIRTELSRSDSVRELTEEQLNKIEKRFHQRRELLSEMCNLKGKPPVTRNYSINTRM